MNKRVVSVAIFLLPIFISFHPGPVLKYPLNTEMLICCNINIKVKPFENLIRNICPSVFNLDNHFNTAIYFFSPNL
jgi:hypothetical protein